MTGRVDDLSTTRHGPRGVASVRVACTGGLAAAGATPWGAGSRGVTLFRDAGFKGNSETFATDVRDLSGTRVGARQASSVDVPEGCVAELFTGPGFSGRSTTFRSSHDNLRLTDVGNDAALSLRVDCPGAFGSTSGGGWGASGRGVTLFRDAGFRGDSETFASDVPDLSATRIGARQASSIDVPEGCVAELFTGTGFSGRSATFRSSHDNLRLTDVGNDAAASLRVDCREAYGAGGRGRGLGASGRGVTLFRDAGFAGDSETFAFDVPDLSATRVGARQASSIDIPEGCVAELFTGTGFSGRSATFREPHDNLRLTDVGNDAAASLRVDCGRRPRRYRPGPRAAEAGRVTLYRDKEFGGASEAFRSDVPDLSRTLVGGRQASSVSVPQGCRVTLFSETDYRGRSATFEADNGDLRQTPIGNDAALSMRLDCNSTRW